MSWRPVVLNVPKLFFRKQFFSHLNIHTIITSIFSVTGPPLGKEDFDNAKLFEEKENKKTQEEKKAAFVAALQNEVIGEAIF